MQHLMNPASDALNPLRDMAELSVHGGPSADNMLRCTKYGKELRNLARLIKLRETALSTRCSPS